MEAARQQALEKSGLPAGDVNGLVLLTGYNFFVAKEGGFREMFHGSYEQKYGKEAIEILSRHEAELIEVTRQISAIIKHGTRRSAPGRPPRSPTISSPASRSTSAS